MVLPSSTPNVSLSLSSTPTIMRFDSDCKNARKKKGIDCRERVAACVGSTRVDEGRKCWIILAVKMKARTEVGREEEGPLCDPGSELLLGGSARVVRDNKWDDGKKMF